MDSFRLNILERINHGDLVYRAENKTETALKEFERAANALMEFERAGLIEIKRRKSEPVNGKQYISQISIRYLTAAGERLLSELTAR